MRRAARIPLSVVVAALLLSGCAAGSTGQGADEGTRTRTTAPHPVAKLRVGLTEWEITTSAGQVTPGRVVMTVTDAGATTHDLYVRGGKGTWHTRDLSPGERQRLVVHASPGERLHLWCSLPGHAAQGMRTTLSVARSTP